MKKLYAPSRWAEDINKYNNNSLRQDKEFVYKVRFRVGGLLLEELEGELTQGQIDVIKQWMIKN